MNTSVKLVIFVVLGSLIVWAGVSYNKRMDLQSETDARNAKTAEEEQIKKLTEQLKIEDVIVGTGAEVKNGDKVSVHYVGTLLDGKIFDSSRARNTPFEFTLGEAGLIQGWNLGITGMKVGGKRMFTVPPELGYGETSNATIPPNSTLKFEIELLGIK